MRRASSRRDSRLDRRRRASTRPDRRRSMPASSRSSVVLPGSVRARAGRRCVPRSTSSDTSSQDVADAPARRRTRTRRQSRRQHRSTIRSSAQQPDRWTCPSRAQVEAASEERRVRHDRVVLAAFAARIDAEPHEFGEQIAISAAAQPASRRGIRRAPSRSCASAPDATHSSNRSFGRAAKQRLHRGQAVRRAHALGPLAMFVEQDVAEHHVRDPVGRQRPSASENAAS